MKNIIIVIMVLFAVSLTGGLYHTLDHMNAVGQEVINQAHVEQLPLDMPDMEFNPAPAIPLY